MLFDARDTIASIPTAEVPIWVSGDHTVLRIDCFLATLIVYDAGEYIVCVVYACLTFHFEVITLDQEVTR